MGLYTRPDSPWIWMRLEGTAIRESTGIPKAGGSPAQDKELWRQATLIYTTRTVDRAKAGVGLAVARPVIRYTDFSRWYETHTAAHHRGQRKFFLRA